MSDRLELHAHLIEILGSSNVYFQPPSSVKMKYPCIVYSLDTINTRYANNNSYLHTKRYQVTVIDKDPDSLIPERILSLPFCSFDRGFTSDNLNHWVFSLYNKKGVIT